MPVQWQGSESVVTASGTGTVLVGAARRGGFNRDGPEPRCQWPPSRTRSDSEAGTAGQSPLTGRLNLADAVASRSDKANPGGRRAGSRVSFYHLRLVKLGRTSSQSFDRDMFFMFYFTKNSDNKI